MNSVRMVALAAIIILYAVPSFCQFSISGYINDEEGTIQSFANILLLHPSDSSLIRGAISHDDGTFLMEGVDSGEYVFSVRSVGYDNYYSVLNAQGSETHIMLDTITLRKGVALKEIEIVARKPLFEQKIDRMVINVESSIPSAGGTALEVLERSPGVIVNRQNDAISLAGKSGVVVMINGKINYMPPEAIVRMLEGMSADNIEKIELITTPPAKYDAEGNAGYINIVLKQNSQQGVNGSYSLSGGYGDGHTSSASLAVNFRSGRLSMYGTYSFIHESQLQQFINRRDVFANGLEIKNSTITDRDPTQRDHNARVGIDFELSEKTVIGILAATYDEKWTMDAFNSNTITTNGTVDSFVTLDNSERNQWEHWMGNFNVQHKLKDDHILSFDADYLYYRDENPTSYHIDMFDSKGQFVANEMINSEKITPINIAVAKLDYSGQLNEKVNVSTGVKGVVSTFNNSVLVESFRSNEWVVDPDFTNRSDLNEKIFAAYGSVDFDINEQTKFQAGLRYEFTDSDLDTEETPNVVDREFGVLFPSVFLSREINADQSINLSYSKRITRPTFNDMAPFVIFLDPMTFFAGNTALQPAISNTIKLDYRYKTAIFSLQYSQEDSTIARFQDRVDVETNQQILAPINMRYTNSLSASIGVPLYIGNWWEIQSNVIYTRSKVASFYNDQPVTLSVSNLNINMTHSFNLPKKITFQISGFYNSKSLFGIAQLDPYGAVNIGLSKDFGENWGTLRLAGEDIFNTLEWAGGTSLPDQGFETFGIYDFSRPTIRLSYTRNFGNKKLKEVRKRDTGSEAERRRVN